MTRNEMKRHMNLHEPLRSKLGRILGLVCLCAPLAAQTPVFKAPDAASENAKKEMKELFQKVERRLREIDRLLSDASAGDRAAMKAGADSGMGALLEGSQARGRDVLGGIDRILELAQQLGDEKQSSGGSGSGEPSSDPSGKSPLDQRGQESTQRESTPAKPEQGEESPGQKPGEKGQPQEPKPKPGEQTPKDGQPSNDDPRNSPGAKPPAHATEGPNRNGDGPERWGELPVHARDVFRIEGGGDMPVQYRDWIDSYYRRLNKKP